MMAKTNAYGWTYLITGLDLEKEILEHFLGRVPFMQLLSDSSLDGNLVVDRCLGTS